MVARCFASQDYIEGRTAFMEKRKPKFSGEWTRMSSDAGAGHNRRELMLNVLTVVVTIAVCLVAAEVVLRFLPSPRRCARWQ